MSNETRERGSGRLYRRGDVWWIQYYSHGHKVRTSAHTDNPKKAAKLLRRKLAEVETGVHRDLKRLTYKDLRRAFFDDYITNGKKSLRSVKATGKPRLDSVTRLDGFFTGYSVGRIDTDLIRTFIKDQLAAGLANGSINRSLAALRRMFRLAVQDEKLKTVPYFPMLKEAAPRKGTLSKEKYPVLLAALPDYLRPVLVIGYHTGMRLGEILRLKWEQVDFLNRVIRLDAGTTKNDEAREVPISPDLLMVLEGQHRSRRPECKLVCHRHGEYIRDFRRAWYAACVTAGLGELERKTKHERGKYRGLIFHDLRRTFVTDAEYSGAPRHEVMKISGHKTESVYKRYAIDNRTQREAAMSRIVSYRNGHNSGTIGGFEAKNEGPDNFVTETKQ